MKRIISLIIILLSIAVNAQNSISDSLKLELENYKKSVDFDSNNKDIINMLNEYYYQNLQTNQGLSKQTLEKYNALNEGKNIKNKSIMFLFDKYQRHITETAMVGIKPNSTFQVAVMNLLAQECIDIHKTIPVIILIYLGEALMSDGKYVLALSHFESSLKYYPTSIPIQVYLTILDPEKYAKLKKVLLRKNKNHWMVKQMLR